MQLALYTVLYAALKVDINLGAMKTDASVGVQVPLWFTCPCTTSVMQPVHTHLFYSTEIIPE